MDVLTQTASVLTVALGIGILGVACFYVWGFVVMQILKFFKIHELFFRFMVEYYRRKRDAEPAKPSIIREEDE